MGKSISPPKRPRPPRRSTPQRCPQRRHAIGRPQRPNEAGTAAAPARQELCDLQRDRPSRNPPQPAHHLILLACALLPAAAETVDLNGKTVELPASELGGVLANRDITGRLRRIRESVYEGTEIGQAANLLLAKIRREGPSDANLAALAELERKLVEPSAPLNPPPTVATDPRRVVFNVAIQNGFDTGLGFTLALHDADRSAFTQMLVLVNTAKEKGLITDATPQTIADIDGQPRTLTTGEFTRLMLAYGSYYKGLWDKLRTGD